MSVSEALAGVFVASKPPLESFELEEPLGGGGIAEIWQARHPLVRQTVAVKIAREHLIDNPHVHHQFEREQRAATQLQHRGIVRAFYGGTTPENTPYLVMECVEGRPLSQFVGQPLRWRFLRAALLQLCEALDYMHGKGVLHQDLKPSNLLIDFKNRQLKIADFGLASFERSPSGTTTRSVLGTPAYMAPEQARGQLGWLGPHTDLYTVGVLLYELLNGAKPFSAKDARVVMLQHCTAPVPPLELREDTDVPDGIHKLLDRLLAKNPNARISTARELYAKLLELE